MNINEAQPQMMIELTQGQYAIVDASDFHVQEWTPEWLANFGSAENWLEEICDAHNAAIDALNKTNIDAVTMSCAILREEHRKILAAERQRREQAEGAQRHMEACRSLLNVSDDDVLYEAIDDMKDQLLSALAAMTEHNNDPEMVEKCGRFMVDPSVLQKHDANALAKMKKGK